ncbi:unknown [Tannerella sp. CAG:118]|uniref:Uncharacterized protein n=1 Tax=Coprobacter secundus subsp. similis TaxID=2751153 RepID=A0A7G1HUE5_9BACT|nr:hypothetical protein Cop2CBH44_17220 [Coprobacter secundus subsp. similis]CCY36612.1 unknown [Tannerella sp. CAG:118]
MSIIQIANNKTFTKYQKHFKYKNKKITYYMTIEN